MPQNSMHDTLLRPQTHIRTYGNIQWRGYKDSVQRVLEQQKMSETWLLTRYRSFLLFIQALGGGEMGMLSEAALEFRQCCQFQKFNGFA